MKSRAFTLVELLVVVAIIALLLSILLPALSKARIQAMSVVEQSNMRQVAVANAAYATSNQGRVVAGNDLRPHITGTVRERLYGEDYLVPDEIVDPAVTGLTSRVWGCPIAHREISGIDGALAYTVTSSWYWNAGHWDTVNSTGQWVRTPHKWGYDFRRIPPFVEVADAYDLYVTGVGYELSVDGDITPYPFPQEIALITDRGNRPGKFTGGVQAIANHSVNNAPDYETPPWSINTAYLDTHVDARSGEDEYSDLSRIHSNIGGVFQYR